MSQRHAIIIGGGIGGLATAIALQQAGLSVAVYEQAPVLREVGTGIGLWANAVRVLDKLGVGAAVRALKPPAPSAGVYTWRGQPLITATVEQLERRSGAVSVVLHRAELLDILHDALGAATLHLNQRCVAIHQDAGGVTAQFADGEIARGDLLIGADGIRSTVRTQLVGDGEPLYAGYTSWRAIVPADPDGLTAGEYWGHGARFGIIPLTGGRVYWFATLNTPAGQHLAPLKEQELLLDTFRGWYGPIEELIRATDPAVILRHDIADRPPLRRWSMGRVMLLGDAAHPMTPNLGQGACQALEDAVVLADALCANADTVEGLLAYERQRIPRTSRIVLQARRVGQMGQWDNPLACSVRTVLLRYVAPRLHARNLDQIIGYVAAS